MLHIFSDKPFDYTQQSMRINKKQVLTFSVRSSVAAISLLAMLSATLTTEAPALSVDIGTFAVPLAGELRQVGGALLDINCLPTCCSARLSSSNEIIWAGTRFRRRWSAFRLQLISTCELLSYIPPSLITTIKTTEHLWDMVRNKHMHYYLAMQYE